MDLRAEVRDRTEAELDRWVEAVGTDWRTATLSEMDAALCAYAETLTLRPGDCSEQDVRALRQAGLDDLEIHRANQVIGYFNYINRVADGLGVDLEPEMDRPEPG